MKTRISRKQIESNFESNQVELAKTAKVLGHPARLALIKLLMANNNQTCKMLVDKLPFSQSTVSSHLQKLKTVGIIEVAHYKTASIYSIKPTALQSFKENFDDFIGKPKKEEKQLSLF